MKKASTRLDILYDHILTQTLFLYALSSENYA